MIQPIPPTKPKSQKPTKSVIEDFYLYFVRRWVPESGREKPEVKEFYEFVKDDLIPCVTVDIYGDSYGEEPDGDYDRVESIPLPLLLSLLKDNNIDMKNVTLDNQVYYRKNNGQIVLHVSKELSDEAYAGWVRDNEDKLGKYDRDKTRYPELLAEYKEEKKLWDIFQMEKQLEKLKGPKFSGGGL